jgi:hypothetical protein
MNWTATIANSLWLGSSLPAWAKFRRALDHPAETQWKLLRDLLAQNAGCDFGRVHGFAGINSYEEFTHRVPLMDHPEFAPWCGRIRAGEPRVLTTEPVTHLIPTSGSTGARKLIPFTAGLQRQFDRAIGPWLADLARQQPRLLGGPAYWSITPPAGVAPEPSAVPVGFADDASYLGGVKARLARAAMVVPKKMNSAHDPDNFRFQTLFSLMRERDLRLVSVWHPSFLTLLLDALPQNWEKILDALGREDKSRVRELADASPLEPQALWPRLTVISCWGDGHAGMALADLRRRFPKTVVQPKGLLATEAVMTIPFGGLHPAAVRSHFFEFIDGRGNLRRLHELREGEIYETVVTTAGGLWRYRMKDQVEVTGFCGRTPSLRFVGRSGNVSDLFGEKISEAFAASAIQETLALFAVKPRFVLLAPEEHEAGWRYTLYTEGVLPDDAAKTLDRALRQNPHYSLCRDLGQLQPAGLFSIMRNGYEMFASRLVSEGQRLGDIKPTALSRRAGWSKTFSPVKQTG